MVLASARLITGLGRGSSTAAGQIERYCRSDGSPVPNRRIITQPPQRYAMGRTPLGGQAQVAVCGASVRGFVR